MRLARRSQERQHPVGVIFGDGQAITEVIRADNDVPSELWEEEPGQARVLFQGHDGVFRLRPEHPESARLRVALDKALRQKARVWFIAQTRDLTLLDVLPDNESMNDARRTVVTLANQERLQQLITRLQTPGYTGFLSTTLPLFANKGDHLALFGSGVLFQLADYYFLITAAHVMDEALEAEQHGYSFFVDGKPGQGLLPLNKFLVLSSLKGPLGRDDDPFDLSVARLPKELAETLVLHRRFLRMPEVDAFDPQHRDSAYVIYGYPSAGLTTDLDTNERGYEPMLYGTSLCRRDVGALHPPHDPKVGYLLNFSQQYCARLDGGSGGPRNPKGISGCGIWRIIADAAATDRWKPDDVRLVGIEHGWRAEKHYVRGTRIGYAIAMILEKYPELRPVVELSRPFTLVL